MEMPARGGRGDTDWRGGSVTDKATTTMPSLCRTVSASYFSPQGSFRCMGSLPR